MNIHQLLLALICAATVCACDPVNNTAHDNYKPMPGGGESKQAGVETTTPGHDPNQKPSEGPTTPPRQ